MLTYIHCFVKRVRTIIFNDSAYVIMFSKHYLYYFYYFVTVGHCPLGMEDERIKDNQLSSSSILSDSNRYSHVCGRLDQVVDDNCRVGWIAKYQRAGGE